MAILRPPKVLLVFQILIRCYQEIETFGFGGPNQIPVAQCVPSLFEGRDDRVPVQPISQRGGRALIEKDSQATARLRFACSRTASTCSFVTPGNQTTNSSTRAPPSKFSKRADTGSRVPRKTQAPLIFSGERSTTGHDDQSITA
jgi:hypothetical protein